MTAGSMRDVVLYFLRLGTFGFGGPIALAGYIQRDLVERRGWITERDYLDGLALAQLAPGPLAAQLAIYLGWVRGRVLGATLVGVAFVAPSFLMVLGLAAAYVRYGGLPWMQGAFYGIGAAVIAIIARSAFKLTRMTLAKDRLLWAIFAVNAVITGWSESEIAWVLLASGLVSLVVKAAPAATGAIAGAAFVLGKRAIIDLPPVLICLGALVAAFKLKKAPEPVLIAVAGLVGILAVQAFRRISRGTAVRPLLAVAALLVTTPGFRASLTAQVGPAVPTRPTPTVPRVRAGIVTDLRLDGRLDEAAWGIGDSIAELVQVEPVEGAAPTARTVVRVLASSGALIIGVRADDPDPAKITSFARARDAALENEDHIKVVLDTYLDGRTGYVFAVNLNGARYDALVSGQGESENSNWDGVWEAAAARTPTGWSVEIRIPIRTLLFGNGLADWGFNVQRRIQRLQETDRWASPTRNSKITHVARAGLLTNLPPFNLGLGLSIRPSLAAGGGIPSRGSPAVWTADPSLDVTQRIRANTLASLTVRTDFAETEVDTRRTNLTRFPLFFPEKRTFFLEGADIFEFGLGTGEDLRPFFTRRIGLLEGTEVPLDVGLKISGREAGTNFGALVERTGAVGRAPAALSTANTIGVVRVRQNLLGESSAGVMATFGDPFGRADSWVGGADLTYQTSRFRGDKNFLFGAWGLAMDRAELTGRKRAFGAKIDYPNDRWDVAATYKWLGDGFDPSLGFVPRPAVQIMTVGVNYQPRPERPILGLRVRQMFHEFQTTLVADLEGNWESYRVFMAPINWRLESGDRFELNAVPVGERLTEPFEIATGVTIPAGPYHWTRYRLEAGLATKRKVSGQATWWFGGFYEGRLSELQVTAAWKPSSLVIVELNGTRNVARLPEGDFTQNLVGGRLRLNVSPDLQFNSYLQYDNESDNFGTNTRVRWTFSPVGELFLVYNHNVRALDPLTRERRWRFDSNQVLVKMQYALRY